MTQSHLTSALAGAVIAAALVPPFTTSGPQVVFLNWIEVSNEKHVLEPPLLVSINVLTIMLGAAFVLWASVMKPDSRSKVLRASVFISLASLGFDAYWSGFGCFRQRSSDEPAVGSSL